MTCVRRVIGALLLSALALTLSPRRSEAHPLHTTFVELSWIPASSTVSATVKVFADDFLKRISRGSSTKPTDEALEKLALAYLARTLVVSSAKGGAVQWRSCGWKRSADLIFICLSGASKTGLKSMQISDAILTDVFADQVNVLQAAYGGERRSLLFMTTTGAKQLP